MRLARTLALAPVLAAAALGAPAAHANDRRATTYGGIEFSDSDRDLQAYDDTRAIDVSPAGDRVVSIGVAGGRTRAYRYGADGRQHARFRVPGSRAVAIAGDGDIYVGLRDGTVRHYSPGGAPRGSFSADGPVAALDVGSDGSVYVASGKSVRRYGPGGSDGGSFGGPGEIGAIADIAVDDAGNVFVADPARMQVTEFDASGTPVRTLTDQITESLTGVGVDGAGNVSVSDGHTLLLFGADGSPRGRIDVGLFAPGGNQIETQLLAVGRSGDVFFTPYNPDIQKLPAARVTGPRFRIVDPATYESDDDLRPIPATIGRRLNITARIYPSLATGQRATIQLPAGVELTAGTPATMPVSDPGDISWPVTVTKPGRHAVTVRVDADGSSFSKTFPVYGIRGPHVQVIGAVYLPRARQVFVAARVTIGRFPVAAADRYDLGEYFSTGPEFDITARGLAAEPYSIGGAFEGQCQALDVPRGRSGTARLRVTAKFEKVGAVAGAEATRTVRPSRRVRGKVLKGCLEASGLAGGPTD